MPESHAGIFEAVRSYWDRRPCNIRHSNAPMGTKAYYDEVEARKYRVEPHIVDFADFPAWRNLNVLELGCGIGTDTINFARCGANVTAVDISERSLQIAKCRAVIYKLYKRINFFLGNIENLPTFGGQEFDLVYSFGVIHHTPSPWKALIQARECIKDSGTLKIMVYHKWSWRVFCILFAHGRGRFWKLKDLVATHSEAQTGCPVTYVYSKREIKDMVERCGFKVQEIRVDHIFPYNIPEYVQYQYKKVWYFRWMPRRLFRWLETRIGWHLLVTATPEGGRT